MKRPKLPEIANISDCKGNPLTAVISVAMTINMLRDCMAWTYKQIEAIDIVLSHQGSSLEGMKGRQKAKPGEALAVAVEKFLTDCSSTPPWESAGAKWLELTKRLNGALCDYKESE